MDTCPLEKIFIGVFLVYRHILEYWKGQMECKYQQYFIWQILVIGTLWRPTKMTLCSKIQLVK